MINLRRLREDVLKGLKLSNFFLIPPIIKFPRVLSKNGLVNSFLSILFVSTICSAISNILIHKIVLFTRLQSYSAFASHLLRSSKTYINLFLLLFHLTVTAFSADLCIKLLLSLNKDGSISLLKLKSMLCFFVLFILLLDFDFNQFLSQDKLNLITYNIVLLLLIVLVATHPNKLSISQKLNNKSSQFFGSFPLTFLCFAQQINISPILIDQSFTSILLGALFSCLCYTILGFLGYLLISSPEINFYQSIEFGTIRVIGSAFLMYSTLAILKDQIKNVISDVCKFIPPLRTRNIRLLLYLAITVFFTYLADMLIRKKLALIAALVESCILMNILPTVAYFKIGSTRLFLRILAVINLLIGCVFIVIAIFDKNNKII